MRCLPLKFVGYAAVGALSVVSLSANVLFAVSVATEAHDKAVYGVASASIDVLKFVAVILVVRLWHKHHHVLAILSAVLGVMCVTWSLASAVGYATSTRADMVASRSAIATAREGWVTTVERAQHSLDGLGRHRSIGAIEAELVAAQAPPGPYGSGPQDAAMSHGQTAYRCASHFFISAGSWLRPKRLCGWNARLRMAGLKFSRNPSRATMQTLRWWLWQQWSD